MLDGEWLNWPQAKQIIRVERSARPAGNALGAPSADVAYFITSLGRDQAGAPALLALIRAHWRVEAHFHVRDASLREDACRCRVASVARLMAAVRSACITGLRHMKQHPADSIPRCRRRLSANPLPAYDFITGTTAKTK